MTQSAVKGPDASVVGGVYAVEPPEEAVRPVLPGVAGRRRAAVDIAATTQSTPSPESSLCGAKPR